MAEELEYIETNRLSKTISRIKATKKIKLARSQNDEDLIFVSTRTSRTGSLLLKKIYKTTNSHSKTMYLFYTTFFLGDRKSESYVLKWKHIDIKKVKQIQLVQALDRYKERKSTKGNKRHHSPIPQELTDLLNSWKKQQKFELAKFNNIQTPDQYVFTYIDTTGNVNSPSMLII